MWISKGHYNLMDRTINEAQARSTEMLRRESETLAVNKRLEIENERMVADLQWFKLRLNAIEKERQMLIMDRIGVKIPVPEFVTAQNLPDELDAMNGMPDLSMVGDDAPDGFEPAKELGPDYSGLPARKNN